MENNDDYKCEDCNSDTNSYICGRFTAYFCPVCHSNIDGATFMAEHYSE
jgi:Zn finger protein HypA/HybF involved in hydrogenase expression